MEQRQTVYSSGANDGLIMGLYLSVLFVLQAYGMKSMLVLILCDIMMLGIPVLAYKLLKRGYKVTHQVDTIAAIWLHGIIIFLCGSLIVALVMYVYMRFLHPTFIADQVHLVADAYRSLGTSDSINIANTFDKIIEKKLLPTPISVSFAMIWLIGFVGAMLSLVLALIIKATNRKNPKKGQLS